MSELLDISSEPTQQKDGHLINPERHAAQCTICHHPRRTEVEEAWISWTSPEKIAYDFKVSRVAIYRHCHALGLFRKRQKNLERFYEKIIEKLDLTKVTGEPPHHIQVV